MPSAKVPTDPDHHIIDLRTSFGNIPAWAGMVLQGSTAFPGSNQFRFLENARFFQHGLKSRGGQEKGTTNVISGVVQSMFDAGDIGA